MGKVGLSLCERDKHNSKTIQNSNLPDKQILKNQTNF